MCTIECRAEWLGTHKVPTAWLICHLNCSVNISEAESQPEKFSVIYEITEFIPNVLNLNMATLVKHGLPHYSRFQILLSLTQPQLHLNKFRIITVTLNTITIIYTY